MHSTNKTTIMDTSNLTISSFGLIIQSEQKIDLETLSRTFPLDVHMNSDGTVLVQKNLPVSDSYTQLCTKTTQRRSVPTGFIKIKYPTQPGQRESTRATVQRKTLYTRPPEGPIPIGAWCYECKNYGPYFHKETCTQPEWSSLMFTLQGFVVCIIEKNMKFPENTNYKMFRKRFLSYIDDRHRKHPKSKYLEIFKAVINEFADLNYGDETEENWPFLTIPVDIVLKEKYASKKGKNQFYNPCIVSYNFGEKKVSIRVYDSGKIHIVSCPWTEQNFYLEVIEKLNQTKSINNGEEYVMNYEGTKISNVFSSFSLLPQGFVLDFEIIMSYLWPLDEEGNPTLSDLSPKRVITKVYTKDQREIDHTYLAFEEGAKRTLYRYTINALTNIKVPKIKIVCIPCILNYKNDLVKCKPIKLTMIIFESGTVQISGSFCTAEDLICDENVPIREGSIPEQLEEMETELSKLKRFFERILFPINDKISKPLDTVEKKETMLNTVSGFVPYRKKKKLEKGDPVKIFNRERMKFNNEEGRFKRMKNGKYAIERDDKKTHDYTLEQILPLVESKMQVQKTKLKGTNYKNRIEPYTFHGTCTGGSEYIVPMGGIQARDNRYYPYCANSDKDRALYIDQIIHGFPQTQEDEERYLIEKNAKYDVFSGIFKKGVTDIGSQVRFFHPNNRSDVMEGIIVSKNRSRKKGLDNKVVYTVKVSEDEEYTISGSDFHPDQLFDRRWKGLGRNEISQRIKLLNCIRKLSNPTYMQSDDTQTFQEEVIHKLKRLMNLRETPNRKLVWPGEETNVLTYSTFHRLTKDPYVGFVIPEDSERAIFYCSNREGYFINTNFQLRHHKTDMDNKQIILDGFVISEKNLIVYYAIDCIYNENIDHRTSDYFNPNDPELNGRLKQLIKTVDLLNEHQIPNCIFVKVTEFISPSIFGKDIFGDTDYDTFSIRENSLIAQIYERKQYQKNFKLIFIPMNVTKRGNFILWRKHLQAPLFLQLIQQLKSSNKKYNTWTIGVNGKPLVPLSNTPIKLPVKYEKDKYYRFYLNIMKNGDLNPETPLVLAENPSLIPEIVPSHAYVQEMIHAMLYPIKPETFHSPIEWTFTDNKLVTHTLVSTEIDPGIQPLMFVH